MKEKFQQFKKTKFGSLIFDNQYVLLSFFCAILISLLIALCFELIPFGKKTILRMDLYHQYGPLFAELYERITGKGGMLYSWCSGGGSSFLGNFFNYLSSPLSLCVLAFKHKNIPEAIAFMIFSKACFSSLTFSYYLKKSQGKSNYLTSAFGVLYAFSGYFIAYYWNLMWLDAMVLLPIVLFGIERIIKKGKPTVYIISLAVTLFSNYYMAYMVCIFSVIYFFIYYFANYSFNEKLYDFRRPLQMEKSINNGIIYKIRSSRLLNSGIIFAFASLLAAGICAASLLTTYNILKCCSATSGTFPESTEFYNNIFDFITNHFADLEPTIRSSGEDVLPNIYCGILTVLLVPMFYFTKSIKLKEKVSYTVMISILFLSFNINQLNYIWHGLHFPNDLPYRFSFMYSFIILCMGYKTIIRIKELTPKTILGISMGVVTFIIISEKVGSKNLDTNTVIISIGFAIIYTVILYVLSNKKFQQSAIALFVLCAIISEYAVASTDNYVMNQEKSNYVSDLDEFKELKEKIDKLEGNTYYRMELTDLRTRMDPCWYYYNGVSIFSSMAYEKVANLQSDLGLAGNYINSYTYNMQTPIYNAMFGLKYIYNNSKNVKMNLDYFEKIDKSKKFIAYKNKYNLPIAFSTYNQLYDWDIKNDNPFEVQNQLFSLASNAEPALKRNPINSVYGTNINDIYVDNTTDYLYYEKIEKEVEADMTAFIEAKATGNYYLYCECEGIDDVTVNIDDRTIESNIGGEEFIVDLGKINEGTSFTVTMPIKSDSEADGANFYVYYLDDDIFKQGYDKLKTGALNINYFKDTKIDGTINVFDEFIYTSIPYDQGWTVTIDGKKISNKDIYLVGDALLGIKTTNGFHTIHFEYFPVGLKTGLVISIISFLIFIAYMILRQKKMFEFYKIMFDPTQNIELTNKKRMLIYKEKLFLEEQLKQKENINSENINNYL